MTSLCCKVLSALKGKTLVTAESCTGGGIGAALTAIPGSSEVYKGGIISYTNWVKHNLLGVPQELLDTLGAVSGPVAEAMAQGARKALQAQVATDEWKRGVGIPYACRWLKNERWKDRLRGAASQEAPAAPQRRYIGTKVVDGEEVDVYE